MEKARTRVTIKCAAITLTLFLFQRLVGGKMSQVRLKVSATASFFYVPHLESSGWTYISEVKFRPRWLALSPGWDQRNWVGENEMASAK